MATMKVSLDGGVTFQDVHEGVRIVVDGVAVPDGYGDGQLHMNVTAEGLICDVWTTRNEELDHNLGTRSEEFADIVAGMFEQTV